MRYDKSHNMGSRHEFKKGYLFIIAIYLFAPSPLLGGPWEDRFVTLRRTLTQKCALLVDRVRNVTGCPRGRRYEDIDFPREGLHSHYQERASLYLKAQAQLANEIFQKVRGNEFFHPLLFFAANRLKEVATVVGHAQIAPDRHFAERRVFEMESRINPLPEAMGLVELTSADRKYLPPRFRKEFEHFVKRTGQAPNFFAEDWLRILDGRRYVYYLDTNNRRILASVLYHADSDPWKDALFVLHASPEIIVDLLQDVEARLKKSMGTGLKNQRHRENFFSAYFGALIAMPFGEGNYEILTPLFAGLFMALSDQKLPLVFSREGLERLVIRGQSRFVDAMEQAYQNSFPNTRRLTFSEIEATAP